MGRKIALALVLVGAMAIAAVPANAQTGSDCPSGSVHPVSGIGEIASPAAAGPVSGTVLRAVSLALQQNIALGIWRWVPVSTDPSLVRITPSLLNPRRPMLRLGRS